MIVYDDTGAIDLLSGFRLEIMPVGEKWGLRIINYSCGGLIVEKLFRLKLETIEEASVKLRELIDAYIGGWNCFHI